MQGMGLPVDRTAQRQGDHTLPKGTVVVSADNHWSIVDDIFYDRAPRDLKSRMPRRVIDEGGLDLRIGGKSVIPAAFRKVFKSFEDIPGCTQLDARLADLETEGIQKEIVFGNSIGVFLGFPDVEVRECIYRIYNEYIAQLGAAAPSRFYGVGYVNFWDMTKVRDSLMHVKDLGLKTYLLPINPKGADGVPLSYCADDMEPLWAAAEEVGLPICFHVGEYFQDGPGGIGTTQMVSLGPFRKTFGELIFGGILDRHPSLRVVFVEGDLNWIPGALQTAQMVCECYADIIEPKVSHDPWHYWQNNCYATFMADPAGIRMIDLIGPDRVMWASDYPHVESTYGYSWTAIQAVVDGVAGHDARNILGGTAISVFGL